MTPKRSAIIALVVLIAFCLTFVMRSQVPATGKQPSKTAAAPATPATEAPATPPVPVAPAATATMPRSAQAAMPRAGATPAPRRSASGRSTVALPPAEMPVSQEFLDKLVDASGKNASFTLPDGRAAAGGIDLLKRDAQGVLLVQGKLTSPEAGFFFFQRQTQAGKAGAMVGAVYFDDNELAFRVDPTGPGGSPMLVRRPIDEVICRGVEHPAAPQQAAAPETQNAPQAHPTNIAIPEYQNGVIPLQSLPVAKGVIYLDFDGDPGPFAGWSSPTSAAPSGASNTQIKEVWAMVSEDFQPFNINVTTDRKVYDDAPEANRQRVMITPSFNGGGVAFVGSYNWTGDTVCWSGYSTGKNSAEVISHEVGHTLHLGHDGKAPPGGNVENYYGGGGTPFEMSWAPIMGVGYYANITTWSKGEYPNPTNTEDDLVKITSNNNDVDYRADDFGSTLATAGYLEIQANNSVSNEGIIETRADLDAFRFQSTGGSVSLKVSAIDKNPNLDVLAEIVNATGSVVASDNPDHLVDATVAATLPAGEYFLRVSGVGRGSVSNFGYSDYASLGAYLISGTVLGGIKPERYSVTENTANGTTVGTVAPRVVHEGGVTYSIASGNTGGAFAIDPATGSIAVANSTALDYETLSTRWDDPATYELFVTIADQANPAQNERIRVVISVTNVNEPPTISAGGTITVLERTRAGALIRTFEGTDPDRFDFPTFSISEGNTDNAFAIDASTGRLTFAGSTDATVQPVYRMMIRASDRGTPALSSSTMLTVIVLNIPEQYSPGAIAHTFYDGINGTSVNNLTANARFPLDPHAEELLPSFDADAHGDNYGSTLRGFLIPPATGTYRFWIASDDSSELRLSPNASPSGATVRASVSGATGRYEWTKYSTQTSSTVTLVAGQPYYIEVRHKEGGGGDHAAVAWTGPEITERQMIPGIFLAPHYQNYTPKLSASGLSIRQNAYNGSTVGFVDVTDANVGETHGSFSITGGTGINVFGIDPDTGRVFLKNPAALDPATTPSYTLQIRATDSGTPARVGVVTATVTVVATNVITATKIEQQFWDGIGGNNLSALTGSSRYPNAPDRSRELSEFDSGDDFAETYGSRIRAYLVAPTTGTYKFYIASDDEGQLRFSTTSSPGNAAQIANATGATGRNNWTRYTAQASKDFNLIAGQRYYIEALQKEGVGGDYIQVGWTGPGISSITVIPGSALKPFDINTPPAWKGAPFSFTTITRANAGTRVGTVAATDVDGEHVTYAILGGNNAGAFAIDPFTGAITVANPSALTAGTVALQIGAQDDGRGSRYPLKESTTTVSINVRALPSGSYEEAIVRGDPVGYWRMGDSTAPTAFDYFRQYNGTYSGSPIFNVAGPRPSAYPRFESSNTSVKMNGTGFVTVPPLNLHSNTVTITAWVRRSGNAAANAGIVFSRAGSTVAGLHFGSANELRYTWNDTGWTWSSGLVVPDNQWTFVALVVEPAKATIFMNAGAGLVSATNDTSHAPEEFDGSLCFSQDTLGSRFFNGTMDEVAIFNRALTLAEIRGLDVLPSISLAATAASAAEGGAAGEFTITRTGTTDEPLTVNLSLAGAATWDVDYSISLVGMTATIPGGASEVKVSVTPIDDSLTEPSEPVTLALSAGNYMIGAPQSAIVMIADNDVPPTVQITSPADASTVAMSSVVLTATATDEGALQPLTFQWTKVSGPGNVTFTNAAAANTTASFSAPGAYVLRLTASDDGSQASDDVALTVNSPIDDWRKDKFGTNSSDPAISGNNADPDLDGWSNLLEYALGMEPLAHGESPLQVTLETVEGQRHLTLSAARNPTATDVTFVVEVSSDLRLSASWSHVETTIEVNTPELLRVRDNTSVEQAPHRQIRLKVSAP